MALYAIGDLHLSFSEKVDKPMDIFGDRWENHAEQIRKNWRADENDVTVIAGDISWAIDFDQLGPDFRFIDSLPGKKIILKGNHDYWWTTLKKMNAFAAQFGTISFLHNNSYRVGNITVCGTRGWIAEPGEEQDKKVLAREVGRLRASLQSAPEDAEKIVFLHYPPLCTNARCDEILSVLSEFHIKRCFYGHLHGRAIHAAVNGERDGLSLQLISADYLGFVPIKISEN